jgi:hypothetical protein
MVSAPYVLDVRCTQDQLLEYTYALHLKAEAYALIRDPSPDVRRTALETYSYALALLETWWVEARKCYALPCSVELNVNSITRHFIASVPL